MKLLVGTRGSQLALAQAEQTRVQIQRLLKDGTAQLEVIKTSGDRLSTSPPIEGPPELPAQGIFTKELDEALLSGKIQVAVHSMKDVPTTLPAGIQYAAFLKREDPRDVLVSKSGKNFFELPAGSRIGTGSPRREAQVRAARSDVQVLPLRGNVDTRLRKLQEGHYDAVVLAAAGLRRLGLEKEITEYLEPSILLPAPAQGVVCVVIREADGEIAEVLKSLNDLPTQTCAKAERAFLKTLQGGCRIPVGALASIDGQTLTLSGVIANPNGEQVMRDSRKGSVDQPEDLGNELARSLLANGAQEILNGFGRTP